MPTLRILSAGAAQAVTERIIETFRRDTGAEVIADFGAVGAMKAKMTDGAAVDVITLTQAMIDELVSAGMVVPGSRVDLGRVGTGVAVRAGAGKPDIATVDQLRAAVTRATKLVCPDPNIATAGKVVMACLDKLGVRGDVEARLQFFPNGYAAMGWLGVNGTDSDIGITQVTEILPNKSVTYVGPLPDEFQMKTIYSAGVAAKAQQKELARDFVHRFATAGTLLVEAGYEL